MLLLSLLIVIAIALIHSIVGCLVDNHLVTIVVLIALVHVASYTTRIGHIADLIRLIVVHLKLSGL